MVRVWKTYTAKFKVVEKSHGKVIYSSTSGDGPSYAGTDLNLLALYSDLVFLQNGKLEYQNSHFVILNSFGAFDM